jgi:MFS family permease
MRAASKKATREAATTDKADMNANNNNNNAIAAKRYENGAFTARLMGWREACCTLAFVVGPTVGGIICSGLSLSATIAFTGYASILASILVFVLVVEPTSAQTINVVADGSTEKSKNEGGGSSNDANANVDALYDSQNLSCPLGVSLVAAVGTICVTSFLYNAGQSTFDSFFPLVISRTVGMGPTMIGATLTSLSLVSLSISTLLFAPIFKFFGLTKTCGIGLALVAIGLAMIGVSTTAFTTGLGAFFYVCGVPLFTPSIPILLMQCVPTTSRGAVMGFDSAINSSARIITPVLLGSVFAASRGKAFLCAATCVGAAFVIVVIRSFVVFRETRVKYFPSRNQ